MKRRVLAVSSEIPWPLNTGGHLRTFHVLRALAGAYDLRLVVPSLSDGGESLDALASRGIRAIPVPVAPRTPLAEAKRLLRSRFRGEPYAMYNRHARREVFAAVERELRSDPPDLIHLDHLDGFLFHGMAAGLKVPAVLDLHNVYSLILERMAEEAGNPAKRAFYRGEAKRLAKIERRACTSGAAVVAVSEGEAAHFRNLGAADVTVAPNGVDASAFASLPTGREGNPPTILYLGTLSWGPNASAAIHLARHIFPKVRDRIPAARLLLVGKSPNADVLALSNLAGVTVAGSVPSIQPYLAEAGVLAVPLDSGGGTRLKILEAFAAGLPVVSTAVGAEGIDATDGRDMVIAERPGMADAIADLLEHPLRGRALAESARRLAREKYDWSVIGGTCVELAGRLMRRNDEQSGKIDQKAQAPPRPLLT
jgi:glycosyltransferase involved in cell wall biosynthesis